jgi:hypothetical protein
MEGDEVAASRLFVSDAMADLDVATRQRTGLRRLGVDASVDVGHVLSA